MKNVLLALGVLALVGGVACFLLLSPPAPARPARQKAPWQPYGYQLAEGPRTRSYDLPVTVQANADGEPNVRLLLDVQDEANYYFVELTRQGTRIGKVESGFQSDLGIQSTLGLTLPGPDKAVLKRRPDSIEVVLDGLVVARAEDDSFQVGRIGAGVLNQSATVRLGQVQPCDAVEFADDFMKGATEGGGWTRLAGSWEIATVRNPSLSSNAFYFIGCASSAATPAAAVRGEWFWDNYRFRVACVSNGKEDVGIYFYYQDPDNYWLFRWNADAQGGGKQGRKQLLKRWHGQETLVAETAGGYQPTAWYELEAEVVGPRIRTFIDGHLVFAAHDPSACFGQIGLYSATRAPVTAGFDDVVVQAVRGFDEDFGTVAVGRWRPFGGSWERRALDGHQAYFASAGRAAKAIAGSASWSDQTLSSAIRLPARLAEASEVGLLTHYLDESNYSLFVWRPAEGTARLESHAEGQPPVVETVAAPRADPATAHQLGLVCTRSVVTAHLDGQPLASTWVPQLPRGKIGLYAAGVDGLVFQRVAVAFPPRPEPVLTTNEIFEHEDTMAVWAGAANDWEETYESTAGQSLRPFWHRADFMGDTTMEVELKDRAAEAAPRPDSPRACRLVLSAESTRGTGSGYTFLLAWPAPGSSTPIFKATITREGRPVAERDLTLAPLAAEGEKAESPVHRLRFQRIGHHVIASVNDEPLLAFRDPQPLPGYRAAFATLNLPVKRDDVSVFSDNLKVYTFSRASSDWRPAAGTWDISNRWECDPRWSFFSGVPDSTMLAAIWNKYALEGDVSVEFAVGPKMENVRGGGNYQYARDFNLTLCADGKDLLSGYSFIFGGWGDSSTAITRRGEIVARSSYVIPRNSGTHRRWFYIRAEKRGNTLTYSIDGTRVLSYTDPQPLAGNRMALWSWDCGIMISRVRISAAAIRHREAPGTPLGPCRTIYNP